MRSDGLNRQTHRQWASGILTLVVIALIGTRVANAQTIHPRAVQEIQSILQEKLNRTPAQRKLDSHLHLAGQAARGTVTSSTMPSLPNIVNVLDFNEHGDVHVDIQGTVTSTLLAAIASVGGTVESSVRSYGAVRAWNPPLAPETPAGPG